MGGIGHRLCECLEADMGHKCVAEKFSEEDERDFENCSIEMPVNS